MKRTTDFLGADVCIDAVGAEADGGFLQHVTSTKLKLQGGSPIALNWAIDSVRKGGTISVVGVYGPIFSAVKFGDAMQKGLTLRMNQTPVKRQWPRLFEHIQSGYLSPATSSRTASRWSTSPRATTCSRASSTTASSRSSSRGHDRDRLLHRPDLHRRQAAAARDDRAAARAHPRLGRRPRPGRPPVAPQARPARGPHRRALGVPGAPAGSARRERSMEHRFVTPVFGTAAPLRGVSGLLRRLAYRKFSEADAAHWLLLMAGDRVDSLGSSVTSCCAASPTTR
jgi:hypothetical protein